MQIGYTAQFSCFAYLSAITFKNFKTSKMKPNAFPVHMIKDLFYIHGSIYLKLVSVL